MKPLFSGVCTALVTPFLGNEVNYPMLDVLLKRQIEAKIPAVVLCGTTGEAPTLSDEEKLEIFSRAKSYVGNSMKIIAGTGSNSTAHAISLSKRAEESGADGLLVVTPYYNKANSQGLYAHYKAICDSVSIPVIVYNVPGRTGLDVPGELYPKLWALPNIAGVKEASPSIQKISKIRRLTPQMPIWSGNDDMTVPVISLGGNGVISVLSNLFPKETALMTDAALSGDFDTAAKVHMELLDVMEALFWDVNPIGVKAAMKLIGYDCGKCRMPLTELSSVHYQKLSQLLG